GAGRVFERWLETLPNGVSYETLEITSQGLYDNTAVYVVPDGHLFMMGDNRDNSADSRTPVVGYVPAENLIGRAEVLFLSIEEGVRLWEIWRWPFSMRWNRMFDSL